MALDKSGLVLPFVQRASVTGRKHALLGNAGMPGHAQGANATRQTPDWKNGASVLHVPMKYCVHASENRLPGVPGDADVSAWRITANHDAEDSVTSEEKTCGHSVL